MRKPVDVFEQDYETLLLRAGDPNKICFVVRELINLSDACAKDLRKQAAWKDAAQGTLPLPAGQK